MAKEKKKVSDKLSFNDLDLSNLTKGEPVKAPIVEKKDPIYWLWGIPLAEITDEQFAAWLSEKLPGQDYSQKKNAFDSLTKKIQTIDHVAKMYRDKTILFYPNKKGDKDYRQ